MTGRRLSGISLMLGSAVSFSTVGLFTRAVTAPLPDVLFIRGLSGAAAIWLVARLFTTQRWTDRGNFSWPALAVAALFTLGMTSLVVAYRIGSVVNVSVVYATIPLVIGLFQMLFRGRRPSWIFWLCGGSVVAGVAIMTGRGVSAGDVLGMALAFFMTLCVAAIILVSRAHPDTPMLPASAFACVASSLAAAPFVTSFAFGWNEILLCTLFGVVTLGLGRVFLVLGSSRVPSRDAALIDVLDAPITPLWTWAILNEAPTIPGAIGGGVVILAVAAGIRFDRNQS
ncbi:DMT family transporter [Fodinicola acaciae]|uniref:DMT family transporter n=1 Tax=Fodinicola acaciae TaxID=2681555 RepID=UPI0013D555C9|nr:DMT family transporter [Fodinicola acaciae]